MATEIYVREGSTAQIPFQLLADNVPIDLTGVDKVEINLVPQNGQGALVDYNTDDDSSSIEIISATLGKVGFSPNGTSDLTNANSPYLVYFWVHETGGAKYSVPDEDELIIHVTNDYE